MTEPKDEFERGWMAALAMREELDKVQEIKRARAQAAPPPDLTTLTREQLVELYLCERDWRLAFQEDAKKLLDEKDQAAGKPCPRAHMVGGTCEDCGWDYERDVKNARAKLERPRPGRVRLIVRGDGKDEQVEVDEAWLRRQLSADQTTFEQAWAAKEAEGYQYGEDALEQVRFGWELREQYLPPRKPTREEALAWAREGVENVPEDGVLAASPMEDRLTEADIEAALRRGEAERYAATNFPGRNAGAVAYNAKQIATETARTAWHGARSEAAAEARHVEKAQEEGQEAPAALAEGAQGPLEARGEADRARGQGPEADAHPGVVSPEQAKALLEEGQKLVRALGPKVKAIQGAALSGDELLRATLDALLNANAFAHRELEQKRAEIEMLRGVDCEAGGDGPCGACLKCAIEGRHVRQVGTTVEEVALLKALYVAAGWLTALGALEPAEGDSADLAEAKAKMRAAVAAYGNRMPRRPS